MSRGEVGCALSHLGVYRKMLEDGAEFALVLEDDALLGDDLPAVLADLQQHLDPARPDAVLLSHIDKYTRWGTRPLGRDRKLVRRYGEWWRAHGYVVTRAAAQRLLDGLQPLWCAADYWSAFEKRGLVSVRAVVPYCIGLTELADESALEGHRRSRRDRQGPAQHRLLSAPLRLSALPVPVPRQAVPAGGPAEASGLACAPGPTHPHRRHFSDHIQTAHFAGFYRAVQHVGPALVLPAPELRVFIGAILAMAVVAASEGVIPKVVNDLLDKGFGGEYAGTLWHVPALLTGVALIRGVAQFASGYLLNLISNRVLLKMRIQMFERLLHAPAAFFHRNTAASLINAVIFESTRCCRS